MEFARLPGHVAIAPPLVSGRDESTTTRCARNVNPSGARTRPDVAVCALLFAPRANKKKQSEKNRRFVLGWNKMLFWGIQKKSWAPLYNVCAPINKRSIM
jgi:hypothetical protein